MKHDLNDARLQEEIERSKSLANACGVSYLIFWWPAKGYDHTDTPMLNWLPLDRAVCIIHPHDDHVDQERQAARQTLTDIRLYVPQLIIKAEMTPAGET